MLSFRYRSLTSAFGLQSGILTSPIRELKNGRLHSIYDAQVHLTSQDTAERQTSCSAVPLILLVRCELSRSYINLPLQCKITMTI